MFCIFILESIGTAELLLIGLVALIIFGPRKLPEFARMLGKARNEFKRTTDEFKQTWEREVDFENIERQTESESNTISRNPNQETEAAMKNEVVAPEIKEIRQADFQEAFPEKEIPLSTQTASNVNDKRDWL